MPDELTILGTTPFDLIVTNTATAPLEAQLTHFDVRFGLPDGQTLAPDAIPLPASWADLRLGPRERVEWRSEPQLVLGPPGDYTVQAFLTGRGGERVPTVPETVRVVEPRLG